MTSAKPENVEQGDDVESRKRKNKNVSATGSPCEPPPQMSSNDVWRFVAKNNRSAFIGGLDNAQLSCRVCPVCVLWPSTSPASVEPGSDSPPSHCSTRPREPTTDRFRRRPAVASGAARGWFRTKTAARLRPGFNDVEETGGRAFLRLRKRKASLGFRDLCCCSLSEGLGKKKKKSD